MWLGDLLIGRTLNLCGIHIRFGHRFAWVGLVYFLILMAAAIVSAVFARDWTSTGGEESEPAATFAFIWSVCLIALRVCDIFYSVYTGIRRRIDPRRREPWLWASLGARMLSAFGGLGIVIAGIILLAVHGTPQSLLLSLCFYINFLPLALIYLILLSPCGWCFLCCCHFCLLSPRSGAEEDRRFISRHQNNARGAQPPAEDGFVPPPQVAATEAGREQATKTVRFAAFKELLATDDVDECCICLCSYTEEDVLDCLPCGHYFHRDCLTDWKQTTCPICRQPISSLTHNLHK